MRGVAARAAPNSRPLRIATSRAHSARSSPPIAMRVATHAMLKKIAARNWAI
jgi:hypothetical protein